MREASGSRPPAGLPGRYRQRARCRSSAARRTRVRAWSRRWPRSARASARSRSRPRSCAASTPTACCVRRRNWAWTPMPPACSNLPDDAPVGTPLADYLGLPDASIELKLTPNRADCFGVRGIAFDVAAACGSEVVPFDATPMPALNDATLPIELDAGADAPRYVGRVIEGVDADAAHAGLDGRAPAPQRHPPGQPAGRRDPVRDAGTRPADACVRPRPAQGSGRRAPCARGRER